MVDWEKGRVFKTLPKIVAANIVQRFEGTISRVSLKRTIIWTDPLFDIGLIIFTFDQRIRNSEDKAFAKLVNYSEKLYDTTDSFLPLLLHPSLR